MLRSELIFHNHHTPQISEYAKFVGGKKLICRLIDVLGINNKYYGISGHLSHVETDQNGKKHDIARINVTFLPATEGKECPSTTTFSIQEAMDDPHYHDEYIKTIKRQIKKFGKRKDGKV